MAEYYYVLSSMPYLKFPESPLLSHEEFVESCALWVSSEEYGQLRLGLLDIDRIPPDVVSNAFLRRWVSFENTLRNELVKWRAKNLGLVEEKYIRERPGLELGVIEEVHDALQAGSPYEKEIALLEIRWDFLSHMETGHYFDLTALIIYGLKLQILERIEGFNDEKGREILEKIFRENLQGRERL
ncbi:MAG: DUF2764 family protein [Deltaproteobacteria bacterium]|nr:DUF2764 family protein [Deltaproteobacteria bacterium]